MCGRSVTIDHSNKDMHIPKTPHLMDFVYFYPWTFQNYDKWIQKLMKERRGAHIEWGWCSHAACAIYIFFVCV